MSSDFIASSLDTGSSGPAINLTKPNGGLINIPVPRGFVITRIAAGIAFFVQNTRYSATPTVADAFADQHATSGWFNITDNGGITVYTRPTLPPNENVN